MSEEFTLVVNIAAFQTFSVNILIPVLDQTSIIRSTSSFQATTDISIEFARVLSVNGNL